MSMMCTANFIIPEKEHRVYPPASIQLLSTNIAYNNNSLAMSDKRGDPALSLVHKESCIQ